MGGGAWWAAVHGIAVSDTTERLRFHVSLSCIGDGNGNPLQCSCLENPRDGGAWWVTICRDFGAKKKIKYLTVSIVSPSICCEVMGPDAMILVF